MNIFDLLRKLFGRHGSGLIASAIADFQNTIQQLERGIALNDERANAIDEKLEQLRNEQNYLMVNSSRAETVAAKLRELIK